MQYGKRSAWRKIINSPFSLVILLILLFILGRAVLNIYNKARTSEIKLNQAQLELAKLKDRQSELSRKVSLLSTEQGIEAEARTKYHAVKAGESVAVIIDESQKANILSTSTSISATSTLSLWRKFLHFFGL